MVISGTPSLILSNGSSATYTSGTGSKELIFTLIVAEGESTSSLTVQSLNGSVSTGGGTASPPVTGALENVSINGLVDRFALDTVFIGNPGNTSDTTGFGSVNYGYYIGETEVTNSQYATFLNAVAATDSHELFASEMSISRSGVSGSYSYSVDAGQENKPVVHVSFYDAARFANWLMNAQPAGLQNASTTEEGFYTFTDTTTISSQASHSVEQVNGKNWVAVTSEDEWYKAAYYDPTLNSAIGGYYLYPTGSNSRPTRSEPTSNPNHANFGQIGKGTDDVLGITDVGSYSDSPSPYATFDQGGNVMEWIDAVNAASAPVGIERGGSYWSSANGSSLQKKKRY
ncbi:MAG: SUMF1/EgtB/PvdO family nonheme iron enzyme, partial [Gammaproteobacteria bacterium]|nr:SUMF1/EgtB/PvdO family nonheme iron enzyme [Gammaproteobacteria bacterium]